MYSVFAKFMQNQFLRLCKQNTHFKICIHVFWSSFVLLDYKYLIEDILIDSIFKLNIMQSHAFFVIQ